MKYLLSVPNFFPYSFGGGQVYVFNLARELKKRGHNTFIITSKPWSKNSKPFQIDDYEYEGLFVKAISLNPNFITQSELSSDLIGIQMIALKDILIELKPDFIHINGLKASLITLCNELNIPYVVTAHHPGFACPVSTLLKPDESLCREAASKEICIPCVAQHKRSGIIGWSLSHLPNWIYRPASEILNKYEKIPYLLRGLMFPWLVEKRMEGQKVLLTQSQFIISPSEAMKELLLLNGVPSERLFVISHGIELLHRLPSDKIDRRKIKFGYIGRIDRTKGFHILLQALENITDHKKCELHVFGSAQNERDNKYLNECLNTYRGNLKIIQHGKFSHDKLSEVFSQIDVLVVPSIFLEVFGLVVLEAFSAGRPVIVTKSGGPEELVTHGVNGFVVERNNSKALSEAMQKFIDNPNLIIEMSKNIPHVKTMEEYVDELEKVYSQLLRDKEG
ncbi:MAG: glycosyltransferase [Thermodesulfovibrionales bacterium]